MKHSTGGRGTNQHSVKPKTTNDVDLDERKAYVISKMQEVSVSSADDSRDKDAIALVSQLESAISLARSGDIASHSKSPDLMKAENDIYNTYPYPYASAVVNSTYSEFAPADNDQLDSETLHKLETSYDAIHLDAINSRRLSEESLVEHLNVISELESKARGEKYDSKDHNIGNTIAAKVILAHRSERDKSESMIEIGQMVHDFRNQRLRDIGF